MSHEAIYRQPVPGHLQDEKAVTFQCLPLNLVDHNTMFSCSNEPCATKIQNGDENSNVLWWMLINFGSANHNMSPIQNGSTTGLIVWYLRSHFQEWWLSKVFWERKQNGDEIATHWEWGCSCIAFYANDWNSVNQGWNGKSSTLLVHRAIGNMKNMNELHWFERLRLKWFILQPTTFKNF